MAYRGNITDVSWPPSVCYTLDQCLLSGENVEDEDSKVDPPPRRRDMTNENFEVVGRLMDRLEVGRGCPSRYHLRNSCSFNQVVGLLVEAAKRTPQRVISLSDCVDE